MEFLIFNEHFFFLAQTARFDNSKISIVFNLSFASNTILSCFFLFFLIIDVYFLIPAIIAPISNPTAELVIPTGIPNSKKKAEIGRHPVTTEIKKKNVQSNLNSFKPFYAFCLINHYVLFLLRDFLSHSFLFLF